MRRVQVIVANIREHLRLYRAKHSWAHAFTAFELPSPLDQKGDKESKKEAESSLERICEEAQLP